MFLEQVLYLNMYNETNKIASISVSSQRIKINFKLKTGFLALIISVNDYK